MKNILVLFVLGMLLFISCKDDKTTNPDGTSKWIFVSRSDCKNEMLGILSEGAEECVQYTYKDGTMELKHIDAGFNCCPGSFDKVKISTDNNIILLDETEVTGDCDCLCTFDVVYKIENLPAGIYEIRVNGNIGYGNDKPIAGITVDLSKETSGTICEKRTGYPWSMK
jgi:hypothetical protein